MEEYNSGKDNGTMMIDLSNKISNAIKPTIKKFVDKSIDPKVGVDIIFNAYLKSMATNMVLLEDNLGVSKGALLESTKSGIEFWYGKIRQQMNSKTETEAPPESSS